MIAQVPPPLIEALCAARHGFRVHPLHGSVGGRCSCSRGAKCRDRGKHPRLNGWQQHATTDEERIRHWWQEHPDANVGCVTGRTSGIIVLDIDPRHGGDIGLDLLEQEHGPLPATVQVHTGGGGMHWYFRHPGGLVSDSSGVLGAGLELKADGAGAGSNIVLPGSLHASGRRYEWDVDQHPDEMPLAEAPTWLFVPAERTVTECTELTETAPHSVHSVHSVRSVHSVHSVTDAIARTLPRNEGERNRRIFQFCRHLKSIPGFAEADPKHLHDVLEQWWEAARPVIGTKEWEDSWVDFLAAWPKAWPISHDPIERALEIARKSPIPHCAAHFGCAVAIDLTRLCRELQRSAGSREFFLSCGKAAHVLGTDKMTAWRRFKLLVAEDILTVAERHTSSRATRYRYIGDGVEGLP